MLPYHEEREAKKALEKSRMLKYCPFINNTCMRECVCYYEGRIDKDPQYNPPRYTLWLAGCQNVLVTGEINTNTTY